MNYSLIRWLNASESNVFSEIEPTPSPEEEGLFQQVSEKPVVSLFRSCQTYYLLIIIPTSSIYSPYVDKSRFKKLLQVVTLVGLEEYVTVKVMAATPMLHIYFGLRHLSSANAIALVGEEILMRNNFLLGDSTIKVFPSNFNDLPAKYLEQIIPFQSGIKSLLINRRFNTINCSTLDRSAELFFELIKSKNNQKFSILSAVKYLKKGSEDVSLRQAVNNKRIIKRSDLWVEIRLQTIANKWGIRPIPDIIDDFAEYLIAVERVEISDLLKSLENRIYSSTGYQEAIKNGQTSHDIVRQHIVDYFQEYSQSPAKWIYRINTKLDPQAFTPTREHISTKEIIAVIESIMARSIVPKKVSELVTLINQEIRNQLGAEGVTKYELMKIKQYWHPSFYKGPIS